MRELPSGTVTFLFTDVEGSTRLLHELGDEYAAVLAEHRRVLRDAFERHGGVEVDTQGDAFFVAFAKASDALAAAAEGRSALESSAIRVRMGLHTGEPLVTEEGYVGIDVHRAARIASAGYGGQILVSQSTRDLGGADGLRDLGEHRLKDLTAAERIYQLGHDNFPPLKSLNTTNLPVATNPLVGREREVRELHVQLSNSVRLVTLTGAGGSGKTRLGLQVAAELVDDFPGGVFFVPLAGVAHPNLVQSTICGTIGVREPADLGDQRMLLLIDNFEHVLDAAPAVGAFVSTGSQTKVIVTSRAPLRIDGEQEYPVEPLAGAAAVELFTQRARAVRPDFEPDATTQEICQRLDGLPLALELAASRARSLNWAALLERLDQRLPLLAGGRRDAPERHRTLSATIAWSYDLLPEHLGRLLARLSVFAGTFSIEAAESVADASLDRLDALVEASLLKSVEANRFLMLDTIREFAAGKFDEVGDAEQIARRHADHFVGVAKSTNLSDEVQGGFPDHELAVEELPNFRKALTWAVGVGATETGLKIVIALEQFWVARDPFEGRRWLEALLQRVDISEELLARAELTHGGLVFIVGEYERGTQLYEQSLARYRALGDQRGVASVLRRMGYSAIAQGDLVKARALAEESLELSRRFKSLQGEAVSIGTLAEVEWRSGSPKVALRLAAESAAMAASAGFSWWEAGMLSSLAEWSLERGQPTEAEQFARDGLELAYRIGARLYTICLLALLARMAAQDGRQERAGLLWGALETEEERAPIGQWEDVRERYAAPVLAAADIDFEESRKQGRRLPLDEVVDYAWRSVD